MQVVQHWWHLFVILAFSFARFVAALFYQGHQFLRPCSFLVTAHNVCTDQKHAIYNINSMQLFFATILVNVWDLFDAVIWVFVILCCFCSIIHEQLRFTLWSIADDALSFAISFRIFTSSFPWLMWGLEGHWYSYQAVVTFSLLVSRACEAKFQDSLSSIFTGFCRRVLETHL